jgi:hypothetical protein
VDPIDLTREQARREHVGQPVDRSAHASSESIGAPTVLASGRGILVATLAVVSVADLHGGLALADRYDDQLDWVLR